MTYAGENYPIQGTVSDIAYKLVDHLNPCGEVVLQEHDTTTMRLEPTGFRCFKCGVVHGVEASKLDYYLPCGCSYGWLEPDRVFLKRGENSKSGGRHWSPVEFCWGVYSSQYPGSRQVYNPNKDEAIRLWRQQTIKVLQTDNLVYPRIMPNAKWDSAILAADKLKDAVVFGHTVVGHAHDLDEGLTRQKRYRRQELTDLPNWCVVGATVQITNMVRQPDVEGPHPRWFTQRNKYMGRTTTVVDFKRVNGLWLVELIDVPWHWRAEWLTPVVEGK